MGMFDVIKSVFKDNSNYSQRRSNYPTRRPSVGERLLGRLIPNMGMGFPGSWSQNRVEQVMHMKNWTYVAINAIASKVGQLLPNTAYVHEEPKKGVTKKHWEAGALFGGTSSFTHGLHDFYLPNVRKSLGNVVRPTDNLEPLRRDHPLARLIENPNPEDTAFDYLYESQMYLELTGVCYTWVIRDERTGVPEELWVIPSHWVRPIVAGRNATQSGRYSERLIQYYEIRPWGGVGAAGMMRFSPDEVIMERWKSPIDKIGGFSTMAAIAQWIDSEESITRSRWSQFINQARPEMWIELGQGYEDPDEVEMERIEAKFIRRYQGEANYGRPIITPPGAKVTPLGYNPTEMAYFQSADQIRDMILSAFCVPKSVVGISTDMTFGGNLASQAAFCLDPETECLTSNGWIKYTEISKNSRIACYDPDRDQMIYRNPSEVIRFHYEGDMHQWKGERIDILATPDHRMYTQRFRSKSGKAHSAPWEIKYMKDFPRTGTYRIKTAAPAACDPPISAVIEKFKNGSCKYPEGEYILEPELWLQFLGYYISEGHSSKIGGGAGRQIGITQSPKSKFFKKMRNCIEKTPWLWREDRTGKDGCCITWSVNDKGLHNYLTHHCGRTSFEKKIPQYLKSWPAESLQILLDALLEGDGHDKGVWDSTGVHSWDYVTRSKQLADDVMEIAIKCGYRAWIYKRMDKRKHLPHYLYTVNIDTRTELCVNSDHRTVVPYSGDVWCVTVPTGLFFVRRNGKVHITGNCTLCINPRLAMRGQTLTKKLAEMYPDGHRIKIWWDDCVPSDPQQVNSDLATDNQYHARTPNEVRAARGLPPYKHGGDDPLVTGPGGIVPLPINTGEDWTDIGPLVPTLGQQPQPEGMVPGMEGAIPGMEQGLPPQQEPAGVPEDEVAIEDDMMSFDDLLETEAGGEVGGPNNSGDLNRPKHLRNGVQKSNGLKEENSVKELQNLLRKFSLEELDGIEIYYLEGPPELVLIDVMDWGDGKVGERIGRGVSKIIGDEARIVWQNEGAKPPYEGSEWIYIKPPKEKKKQVSKKAGPFKFSSTQVNIEEGGYSRSQGSPFPVLVQMGLRIPNNDLSEEGRENELHITCKYGLHTNDPKELKKLLSGFGPIEVKLGKTSCFYANKEDVQRGGEAQDVVKVDVISSDLKRLNKLISSKMEVTDKHPKYNPHVTLAYVKPGKGKKYVGMTDVEGMELNFDHIYFCDVTGRKTRIDLIQKTSVPKYDRKKNVLTLNNRLKGFFSKPAKNRHAVIKDHTKLKEGENNES